MITTIAGQPVTMTVVDLTRLSADAASASRHFGEMLTRYHEALRDHAISVDEVRGIQLEGTAAILAIGEFMRALDVEAARGAVRG